MLSVTLQYIKYMVLHVIVDVGLFIIVFVYCLLLSKDCYLVYILTEMAGSTSMVFTRICDSTRLLALILRNLGLKAIPINGHMSQVSELDIMHYLNVPLQLILVNKGNGNPRAPCTSSPSNTMYIIMQVTQGQ
jgi:hypothetical protein